MTQKNYTNSFDDAETGTGEAGGAMIAGWHQGGVLVAHCDPSPRDPFVTLLVLYCIVL